LGYPSCVVRDRKKTIKREVKLLFNEPHLNIRWRFNGKTVASYMKKNVLCLYQVLTQMWEWNIGYYRIFDYWDRKYDCSESFNAGFRSLSSTDIHRKSFKTWHRCVFLICHRKDVSKCWKQWNFLLTKKIEVSSFVF